MDEEVAVTWDREIHLTYHRLNGNHVACQEMPFVAMKLETVKSLGISACLHVFCSEPPPPNERAK